LRLITRLYQVIELGDEDACLGRNNIGFGT
jgi:hypothetical protein